MAPGSSADLFFWCTTDGARQQRQPLFATAPPDPTDELTRHCWKRCRETHFSPEMLASVLLVILVASSQQDSAARPKRQGYYYICGTYPDQYYSLYR
ncbi:unnamed protein product [Heligmosomoides polygyrus]|uniref:Uncharacterized protein n=1 Tax=Heligmosomoides polygyrus TaxID=6339 RepID=A0A183FZK2_HELPZ|nr:unnamed protein product [Heligmosomoides polygyrus]